MMKWETNYKVHVVITQPFVQWWYEVTGLYKLPNSSHD